MIRLLCVAVFAIAAVMFTGCKKDDSTPVPSTTHQNVVMDGPIVPPQLPPPPHS